jgi:hypothetical protein
MKYAYLFLIGLFTFACCNDNGKTLTKSKDYNDVRLLGKWKLTEVRINDVAQPIADVEQTLELKVDYSLRQILKTPVSKLKMIGTFDVSKVSQEPLLKMNPNQIDMNSANAVIEYRYNEKNKWKWDSKRTENGATTVKQDDVDAAIYVSNQFQPYFIAFLDEKSLHLRMYQNSGTYTYQFAKL